MNEDKFGQDSLFRFDVFGFVFCGLAWGCLLGAALSTLLSSKFPILQSSHRSMECFCVCLAILGTLGVLAGISADIKYRNSKSRYETLIQCWKYFLVALITGGLLSGFWLPAVQ